MADAGFISKNSRQDGGPNPGQTTSNDFTPDRVKSNTSILKNYSTYSAVSSVVDNSKAAASARSSKISEARSVAESSVSKDLISKEAKVAADAETKRLDQFTQDRDNYVKSHSILGFRDNVSKKLDEAKASGNKSDVEKYQKELNKVESSDRYKQAAAGLEEHNLNVAQQKELAAEANYRANSDVNYNDAKNNAAAKAEAKAHADFDQKLTSAVNNRVADLTDGKLTEFKTAESLSEISQDSLEAAKASQQRYIERTEKQIADGSEFAKEKLEYYKSDEFLLNQANVIEAKNVDYNNQQIINEAVKQAADELENQGADNFIEQNTKTAADSNPSEPTTSETAETVSDSNPSDQGPDTSAETSTESVSDTGSPSEPTQEGLPTTSDINPMTGQPFTQEEIDRVAAEMNGEPVTGADQQYKALADDIDKKQAEMNKYESGAYDVYQIHRFSKQESDTRNMLDQYADHTEDMLNPFLKLDSRNYDLFSIRLLIPEGITSINPSTGQVEDVEQWAPMPPYMGDMPYSKSPMRSVKFLPCNGFTYNMWQAQYDDISLTNQFSIYYPRQYSEVREVTLNIINDNYDTVNCWLSYYRQILFPSFNTVRPYKNCCTQCNIYTYDRLNQACFMYKLLVLPELSQKIETNSGNNTVDVNFKVMGLLI